MFFEKFTKPLKLINHGVKLPEFKLSDDDYKKYNIPRDASNDKILIELCRHGYRERIIDGTIPREKASEYADRVKKELDILKETYFTDYILMIYSIVSYRNSKGYVKSYGRGSCAGSLVCHLIGITDCDPIKYGLFFERFISKSRAKVNIVGDEVYLSGTLPDIDLDFADEERGDIINHVFSQYPGKFVKLSTTGTYATKALTGELCKILYGWKQEEYAFLTRQVVARFGKNPTPEEVIAESKVYADFCKKDPLFKDILLKLHDCISATSSHASAYFITHDHLESVMPIQIGKYKNNDTGEEGPEEFVSTYDMYTAETLGIKADLLGVKSLSLVGNIAKATGEDFSKIDFNDFDSIYSRLQELDLPHGLFQISGKAAVKGVNKIKPKNFDELTVVSAICRPGAMEFIDQYADYTNNGHVESLHPLFDDILQKTALVCVFQESVLSLFNKIGFSLEECELIRRGIGKKDADKIKEITDQAYSRAANNNIPKEAVDIAINIATKSADYSFNKCCSPDTIIETQFGYRMMYEVNIGDMIKAYDVDNNKDHFVKVTDIFHNTAELFEIELEDGRKIKTSLDHKYLTIDGMTSLKDIIKYNKKIITD